MVCSLTHVITRINDSEKNATRSYCDEISFDIFTVRQSNRTFLSFLHYFLMKFQKKKKRHREMPADIWRILSKKWNFIIIIIIPLVNTSFFFFLYLYIIFTIFIIFILLYLYLNIYMLYTNIYIYIFVYLCTMHIII